jgi:hypothetical protein
VLTAVINLTNVALCERSTISRLLHSLYVSRTLVHPTASWRQAAQWLRQTDSENAVDFFLADFLAARSELGTTALASWPVLHAQIERAVLRLVLFAAGCSDPATGCGEVLQALDSILK